MMGFEDEIASGGWLRELAASSRYFVAAAQLSLLINLGGAEYEFMRGPTQEEILHRIVAEREQPSQAPLEPGLHGAVPVVVDLEADGKRFNEFKHSMDELDDGDGGWTKTDELNEQIKKEAEDRAAADLERQVRSDGELAAVAIEELAIEDKAAADLENQIRSDGEKAAAAIEELDVELATQIRDQPTEDEQERIKLGAMFDKEIEEKAGTLNTMEEKYFNAHPDLTADQRTDAEERFNGVRGDVLGPLEDQKQAELLQLEQMQEERRQGLMQAKQQVEQTRDERS